MTNFRESEVGIINWKLKQKLYAIKVTRFFVSIEWRTEYFWVISLCFNSNRIFVLKYSCQVLVLHFFSLSVAQTFLLFITGLIFSLYVFKSFVATTWVTAMAFKSLLKSIRKEKTLFWETSTCYFCKHFMVAILDLSSDQK